MRTVTISNSFSYIIGSPEERIKAIRDKATNDVTDAFSAAAKAAITHYYGRGRKSSAQTMRLSWWSKRKVAMYGKLTTSRLASLSSDRFRAV